MYVTPVTDAGWTRQHDEARRQVERALGNSVRTTHVASVAEGPDAERVLRDLARRLPDPPRVSVLFGGVSINPQMMGLRGGTELVVATPGRLLDLVDHNAIRLDHVRTLVLDEADRLLDLGFADELTRVLALLPARRQNLLFSATFPASVQSLADYIRARQATA